MTNEHQLDRRTVLKGTAALGAAASVAGCSSLPIVGADGGGSGDLSYGDETTAEIEGDGPRDPYYDDLATPHTFEGSEGDSVRITMDSEELDTHLLLVDSNEEYVAENDDRGFGDLNSTIETTLPADGTYTIWAGSFMGTQTGRYTLALEEL